MFNDGDVSDDGKHGDDGGDAPSGDDLGLVRTERIPTLALPGKLVFSLSLLGMVELQPRVCIGTM